MPRPYLHLDGDELPADGDLLLRPDHRRAPRGARRSRAWSPRSTSRRRCPTRRAGCSTPARAQMGMLEVDRARSRCSGPRFTALALLLARNWAVTDLADALAGRVRRAVPADVGPRAGRVHLGLRARRAAPARPVQRHDGRGRRDDRRRVVAPRQRPVGATASTSRPCATSTSRPSRSPGPSGTRRRDGSTSRSSR